MMRPLRPYSAYKDSGVEWLGDVPEHWEVRRLGTSVEGCINGIWGNDPNGSEDLPCVRVADFDRVRLRVRLEKPTLRAIAPGERNRRLLKKGDLLLEKSGGGDLQPVGVVMLYDHDAEAVCSNFVARMPVSARCDSSYLMYLHSHLYAIRLNVRSIKQTTGIQNLDSSSYLGEPVSFPPLPEQAAIVRFLDHADRRIRRYIHAKQKLITLLEEQKQAIIHQAVTRGIGGWAKLKATGNTWFPDVPAHWDVMPMRRVITRSVDGPHHSPEYLDHGIPFLSARNIKVDRWSLEDVKFISQIDYETFCQRVKPARGDVLYTKGGTTGVARTVDLDYPFQVWVHVAVLKLRKARILPRYLATALNSPRCYEQSQLFTRGATNQDLGLGRMKDIVIPVPPLADQSDIIERVAAIEDQIGSGIKAALHEIELLREYRTRLIADVVTGKLDVREVSAGLPEIDPLADEFDALTTQATETGVMELEDATELPEESAMENEATV